MVPRGNDISRINEEIVKITSALTDERFEDINHRDVEVQLWEETLYVYELMTLINTSTSAGLEYLNMDIG